MPFILLYSRLEREDRVRKGEEGATDYPSLKIVQRKEYWWVCSVV